MARLEYLSELERALQEIVTEKGWNFPVTIILKGRYVNLAIPSLSMMLKIAEITHLHSRQYRIELGSLEDGSDLNLGKLDPGDYILYNSQSHSYKKLLRRPWVLKDQIPLNQWKKTIGPIVSGVINFLSIYLEETRGKSYHILQGENYGLFGEEPAQPYTSDNIIYFPDYWNHRGLQDFLDSGGSLNTIPSIDWQRSSIDYVSGLKDRYPLIQYVGMGYKIMNAYLRNPSSNSGIAGAVSALRKIIQEAPLLTNAEVYRFVGEDDIRLDDNNILLTSGFLSTTLDPTFMARTPEAGTEFTGTNTEQGTANRVILKILIKNPTPAIYIPSFEHEILFDHGKKLKLIRTSEQTYVSSITFQEVEDELMKNEVLGIYPSNINGKSKLKTYHFEML